MTKYRKYNKMVKTAQKSVPHRSLLIEDKPRTLREIALERLRTAIVELHFKPGSRLTERDLCEQLGVSRSVVREVIRHLESEGLVETVPHHGPIVARLDPATAAQIYELRGLLESSAAQAAAVHADAAALAGMKDALEQIAAAHEAGNHHAVILATAQFYQVMFRSGGKTVAWDVVQRLNGRISWLRAMTIASPGRAVSGPVQMRRIYEAIAARQPEAAAAACREHVAQAAAIARSLLSQQG
jgi:DNA-binding GntR family transcriptional regulator